MKNTHFYIILNCILQINTKPADKTYNFTLQNREINFNPLQSRIQNVR